MQKITVKEFWKKMSDGLDKIMMIFLLLGFFLSSYSVIDLWNIYDSTNNRNLLKYKPSEENKQSLEDLKGSVAWLTIDNTNIDYPIMQGPDNTTYLNKDPEGNFNLSGSLFLDYRNKPNFSDEYNLIYGHHMEHNAMFGALDKFEDYSYLLKHESGSLYVGSKKYNVKVFACMTGNASDSLLFNPSSNTHSTDVLSRVQNAVVNKKVKTSGKRILALSTCKEDTSDDRTMVFCTLEE